MAEMLVDAKGATDAFRELMIFSGRSPVLAAEVREFLDHHPMVAKVDVVTTLATSQRIERYQPSDFLCRFLATLRARYGEVNDPLELTTNVVHDLSP